MEQLSNNHIPYDSMAGRRSVHDPAVVALTQLLASEREEAQREEPVLVEQHDPSRLWLLWFAIGATVEVCRLVQRQGDDERNEVFRHVIRSVFDGSARPKGGHPGAREPADRRTIEAFESAGAEAVRSCMRGETRLGYYLDALRLTDSQHA
jgi:hypothetical protein